MDPRRLWTAIGATALGFALVVGTILAGALGTTAQTTAPEVEDASLDSDMRVLMYNDFVASLGSQLGSDASTVDAAVRTALKQSVDGQQAIGNLTTERAAAQKAVIDVTDVPLMLGAHRFGQGGDPRGDGPGGNAPGRDRFDGRGRGDQGSHDGPRRGVEDDSATDEDDATGDSGLGGEDPVALPTTEDPAVAATPTV